MALLVLVGASTVAAATTAATGAGAQTTTTQAATTPRLVLASQSAWAPAGSLFALRLRPENVPAGSTLALTLHDRLQSRTAFDQSVGGGNLGATRTIDRLALDDVPTDATGAKVVLVTTPGLSGGGVYPLEVDVRGPDDQPIAGFVTHEVVADVAADGTLAVGRPLSLAWVWPLQAEPAYLPKGDPDPTVVAELGADGRIGRQVATLAANPGLPVTIAPSPETLDAWQSLAAKNPSLAAGVTSLRAAASHSQVLAGPFVPLDRPSILQSGLAGVLPEEQSRGVRALEVFLGAQLDPSIALPGALDPASLQLLENTNVRRLVLREDQLTPAVEKYTPAHPFVVQSVAGDDATNATVAVGDSGLESFLTGDDAPALRAAHLLAGLAVVAGEQPNISRGITLVNPERWDPDPAFLAALTAGLQGNPLVAPGTVTDLLTQVPVATADDGAPVVRQLAPYKAPAAPLSLPQYEAAQSQLDSVRNLVGPADPRTLAGERALASSVTSMWQNPVGRVKAAALVGGIGTSVNAYLSQIEIPAQTSITLTSSKADIPITMKNNGTTDVTVHVALQSDRLLFPEGSELDVLLPHGKSTTVRIPVETRSAGTSRASMTVTAAGLPVGDPVQISVKSSFVSGVGLFLTIGAIVFLAVWWGWDIHRRRKRGRAAHPTNRFPTPQGSPA
ncbi:MAG: DUF6049 family protein [Acidimicrobiia bacterium]